MVVIYFIGFFIIITFVPIIFFYWKAKKKNLDENTKPFIEILKIHGQSGIFGSVILLIFLVLSYLIAKNIL